jgi:uncharacterized protein
MRCTCASFLSIWLVVSPVAWGGDGGGADVAGRPAAGRRLQAAAIFDRMAVVTLRLTDDNGGSVVVEARVALSSEEQQAGFQYISPDIIKKSLILFVFPVELVTRFHMRNVEAPLDIAFIDGEGAILEIQEMQPDRGGGPGLHTYGPNQPFRYALEAPAGFFKDHHISAEKGRMLLR